MTGSNPPFIAGNPQMSSQAKTAMGPLGMLGPLFNDPALMAQVMPNMLPQFAQPNGGAMPYQPIAGVDMPMPHLMPSGAAPGGSGGTPPMGGVPGAPPAPPMPERKPGPGAVDEDPMTWDTQTNKPGLFKRLLDAARSMSAPEGAGSPGPNMMPFRRQGW